MYDRRGYGRSDPFGTEPTPVGYLSAQVQPLFELLDALSIGPVILFGHSDGGSIALLAAAAQPARVCGVISEAAHVFVEEETLDGVRAAKHAVATTDLPARLARYHGDKVDAIAAAWIDSWLSPAYRDWIMMPGVGHTPHRDARDAVLRACTEFLTRAVVSQIKSPVL